MNVILLGPQGSGKGTQADLLAERMPLVHLASGDVLRAARASESELGAEVRRYYDAGELVPDEITVRLMLAAIQEHLDAETVVLDGFPRTVEQAQALDAALAQEGERIDSVIELTAPLDILRERLAGRLVCRSCGTVYNVYSNPPKVSGVCDVDGGELYQRSDDTPEAIDRRLSIWERENTDLVSYYQGSVGVDEVDANRSMEAITDDLESLLRSRQASLT